MSDELDILSLRLPVALQANPADYARTLGTARATGLPLDTVERDREAVELRQRQSAIDFQAMREETPGTTAFLSENPEVLPAVHDRLEEMGTFERVLTDVQQNWSKSWRDHAQRRLEWKVYRGTASPADQQRLREMQEQPRDEVYTGLDPLQAVKDGRWGDVALGVPGAIAEQATVFIDQAVSRAEGLVVGAAGGFVAGGGTPALVAPGAVFGQATGGFLSAFKLETPGIYTELAAIEGVTEDQARVLATLAGGFNASLEYLGTATLLKRTPGVGRVLTGLSTDALKEVMRKRTFVSATRHLLAAVGEGIAVEGGTEFLQEATPVVLKMAANRMRGRDAVDGFEFDVAQPDGSVVHLTGSEAIWARLLTAAARGAQTGGGMSGLGEASAIVRDVRAGERSESRLALGDRLVRLARESELRQRDPETFAAHVRTIVDKGLAPESVEVSAEALREFFSTAPDEDAQALLEAVPALLEQDAEVSMTGQDYRIPMDQYLAHFAQDSVMDAVSDHIRYDPADLTRAELSKLIESGELERRIMSLQDKAALSSEDSDVVAVAREHFVEQLRKVHPESISGVLAAFSVARLRERARRRNVSVRDILAEEGLPFIRVEGEPLVLGATLEQRLERRSIARTLADMRGGVVRAEQNLPVRPVLSALRDMGGVDPASPLAGDLRAKGIADRGRGSFPGLFRKGGTGDLGALDWTEQFPELAARMVRQDAEYGRVEPESILEAIGEELRGRPLRTEQQETAIGEEKLGQQAIQEALAAAGLTLDAADEDILAALVPTEQGEGQAGQATGAKEFESKDAAGTVRGKLQVSPDLTSQTIVWTNKADLSTFIHENGHLWLEQLQKDAQAEGADPSLARDLATLRTAFGLGEGEAFGPEQHERFARMVEEWLMEGRAPSLELEGAFHRFSRWMIDIYKTLRATYFGGVPLSDEVRDVLDRMVASDDAIAEARAARGLNIETFADMGEAGMDLQEWQAYQKALEEARVEQDTRLSRKFLAEMKRRIRKDWKANRARVADEIRAEMAAEPLWAARHWLQRGSFLADQAPEGWPAGMEHVRLDRDDLVRNWGPEILKELPKGRWGVWSKDGMPADMVAELFGVESGDKLVRYLADTRKHSLEAELDARTDERMRQEYGELETAAQVEAAAVEALSHDHTVRALVIEERALARRAGRRSMAPETVLRAQAERSVGRTRVADLQPHVYRRAALKASRAVTEALHAGDDVAAMRAKQRQLMSLLMESAARRAQERSESNQKRMSKLLDPKNATRRKTIKAGHTYWDQVEALLERYEFKQVSKKKIAQRESLADWIRAREIEDESVEAIPEWVRNDARVRNWSTLTVDELQGLRDAVDNITTLARRKVEFMEGSEHRSMDSAAGELVAAVQTNVLAGKPPTPPGERPRGWRKGYENVKSTLVGMDAEWLKIEQVLDRLDGFTHGGPWRRFIWQPLAEARNERLARSEAITAQYQKLVEAVAKGREKEMLKTRYYRELERNGPFGTDGRYSRWGLIMIALNLGNESNAKKLLEGYGWNEAQVMAVLDRELTDRDKAFVQDTFDLINSMWPEIDAQARKLTGTAPKKVEGRTITIGGTTIRGQYFPVVYDLSRSRHSAELANRDSIFSAEQNQWMRPTTGHGWEQSRTAVVRPIMLDASVIAAHLDQVILDLTHREPLLRVDKLLRREDVRNALLFSIGEAQYNQLRPWLQRIAQDRFVERTALSAGDRFLRGFRVRATTLGLGLRATTLAMQVGGHANAVGLLRDRLGPSWRRHWLGAVTQTGMGLNVRNMIRIRDQVFELSGFMRGRVDALDRDMRLIQRQAEYSGGLPGEGAIEATKSARAKAMGLIGQVQLYTVDIPTWLAAYNGAIEDLELTHDQAVDFADQMVSQSQGSGGAMDLSAIQAGAESWKQMVLFFSYQNTVYQQLRNAGVRLFERGDVGNAVSTVVLWLTIPAVFSQLVRSVLSPRGAELPDEPEEWAWWLAAGTVAEGIGTVPFAREAAPAITALLGYGKWFASRTPYQRFVEDFRDLAAPKDAVEATADAVYFSFGWLAGLPVGDITKRAEQLAED